MIVFSDNVAYRKVRVRLGRKAKSTALQPRSLTSLNVQAVDTTTEYVDENVLGALRVKNQLLGSLSYEQLLSSIVIECR